MDETSLKAVISGHGSFEKERECGAAKSNKT
jgi:hypothetical protein